MSANEKDRMGKIFQAAYYLVKSNQAFKKFPLLIEPQELEGIKFMESYKNDESVREVIINIAEEIKNEKLEKVARCNFVSFLCDASTYSSTTEKEQFCFLFFSFVYGFKNQHRSFYGLIRPLFLVLVYGFNF